MYKKQFAEKYEYLGWGKFSKDIYKKLSKLPIKGKSVLDIACGTGVLANLFAKDGYNVTAFDKSSNMIKVAKCKKNKKVKFLTEDMLKFNLDKKFDLITCMYDSINHIKNWELFFKKVFKHLNDNGLFVFDFNTVKGLRKWKNTFEHKDEKGKIIYSGQYDNKKRMAMLNIKYFSSNSETSLEFEENFKSYAFAIAQINKWLKQAGFSYKHLEPKNKNPNRHFLVCKKNK